MEKQWEAPDSQKPSLLSAATKNHWIPIRYQIRVYRNGQLENVHCEWMIVDLWRSKLLHFFLTKCSRHWTDPQLATARRAPSLTLCILWSDVCGGIWYGGYIENEGHDFKNLVLLFLTLSSCFNPIMLWCLPVDLVTWSLFPVPRWMGN